MVALAPLEPKHNTHQTQTMFFCLPKTLNIDLIIKTFVLFLLINTDLFAQKSQQKPLNQIEIVHADVLSFNKFINANKLTGHVVCKHENTFFYCDSMYLFPNQSLKAYGNIKITSDSINITGEYAYYDALTKEASIEKNVICSDHQIVLKTEVLQYNTQKHIAYYLNGGEVIRESHTLTSNQGYYYTNNKTLAFKNNVLLINPEYKIKTDTLFYYTNTDIAHFNAPTIILSGKDYLYCEKGWYDTKHQKAYFSKNPMLFSDNKKLYADSLFYDELKKTGYAYQNIRLLDSSQTLIIKGNYGEYNMISEKNMITRHPEMIKIRKNKDTLFLSCDTIISEKKENYYNIRCLHNAKLFNTQLQGLAQTIVYLQKDSIIHFISQPRFWFDKNQCTSKTAKLFLNDNGLNKIILDTNVIIVQEADTIYHNKYNQISSRKMEIFFQNDSIKNIYADGNAQIIYFIKNQDKKWTGINKTKCGNIRVDFIKNDLYKIVLINHPESEIIPIKKIDFTKEKLPYFDWSPQLKPERKMFY